MHTISEKSDAQMAESVDALVSNTSRFTPVPVRPRLWVLKERNESFSLFLSVLSGERVQHAVHRVCFVGCWQACLPRPTSHPQATPILATLSLPISAALTLIGGCANKIMVYCSTLRSALYGVRASASHFDPGSGY